MKKRNVVILSMCSAFLLLFLIVLACNLIVVTTTADKIYDDSSAIPHNSHGLLLATSPIAPTGHRNLYFDDRVEAAAKLYKEGKIDSIIASGGDYRIPNEYGYDEPSELTDSLIKRGVPASVIIKDYDGQRSIYSIQNVKNKYHLDNVTIISQKFHNQRAVYLADHYDLNVVAFNANDRVGGRLRLKNYIREYFARVKVFIDLVTMKNSDKTDKE